MSGPSDVKSVPEPAGKQLELPAPLELLELLVEPPLSSPDPESDVLLDDPPPVSPLASSPPELVELVVEEELVPPLLVPPLLVPPLPDELVSKPLEPLVPPDPLAPNWPLDPNWPLELPPLPAPASGFWPLAQ
jgi:hypothetical protein